MKHLIPAAWMLIAAACGPTVQDEPRPPRELAIVGAR